jgi:hypothetical protein
MKYPRTYHVPFSPGATKDDKKLKDGWFEYYRGKEIVLTEKLDGENSCLCQRGVFARSHGAETRSPWSINLWGDDGLYWKVKGFIDDDLLVFGENLYGEHSIHYSKLKDYFHVFACYNETTDKWWSWDDVKFVSKVLGVPHVPTLWRGKAESEDQLKELIFQTMNMPSAYSGTKEGIVMRLTDEFDGDEFPNYVCKYVRPNHVQTDEHWTRNWKKAELITT